ncbi:MAG: N-acetyl-D-Glu racemase DgcA [Pseudomonadota bacterium]
MARLGVSHEVWPLASRFEISRGAKTSSEVVVVQIEHGGYTGWGECVPYPRYNESIESVRNAIEAVKPALEANDVQFDVGQAMPPGAARCAVDNALWDLRAKLQQTTVSAMVGITKLEPVTTAYTLGIDSIDAMAANATRNAHRSLLKIKLSGEQTIERVEAIRNAAPDAAIIVDANEAWTPDDLERWLAPLSKLNVALVEQPLPAGADDALRNVEHLVPVGADESVHSRDDLPALRDRYDVINIKLDKSGGLTEALAMKREAISLGFDIMVGCMVGTSLSMAPAVLVAQGATFVDLDGPLLLDRDREPGLRYDGSTLYPPSPDLWG